MTPVDPMCRCAGHISPAHSAHPRKCAVVPRSLKGAAQAARLSGAGTTNGGTFSQAAGQWCAAHWRACRSEWCRPRRIAASGLRALRRRSGRAAAKVLRAPLTNVGHAHAFVCSCAMCRPPPVEQCWGSLVRGDAFAKNGGRPTFWRGGQCARSRTRKRAARLVSAAGEAARGARSRLRKEWKCFGGRAVGRSEPRPHAGGSITDGVEVCDRLRASSATAPGPPGGALSRVRPARRSANTKPLAADSGNRSSG